MTRIRDLAGGRDRALHPDRALAPGHRPTEAITLSPVGSPLFDRKDVGSDCRDLGVRDQ
jgi:hypothetical protein